MKPQYFGKMDEVRTKLVNAEILVNVKVVTTKFRLAFILFSKAIIPAVQVWIPAM